MRQLIAMPKPASNPPDSAPAPALPRLRVPRLCVAIQAGSPAELVERAEGALAASIFLEFRLDSLPKPEAAFLKLKGFLPRRREVTAIAPCRRKPFGGHFAG